LANKANKQQRQKLAKHAAALADSVSAANQHCSLFAAPLKTATNLAIEKALAKLAEFAASWAAVLADMVLIAEQHCHEVAAQEKALAGDAESQCRQKLAACAAALAELVSAVEQSFQELADCPAVLAETTLTNQHCCRKEAERSTMLGETALAVKRRHSLLVAQAAESTLAMARVVVLADLSLPGLALAEDKQRQEETAKTQRRADDKHVMVPVLLPDPGNVAIRCIWLKCALLAAPLDAILAEIERDDISHEAQAPPTTTLPHPAAMLSNPPAL
jgi:hypothetical protein